jgi:pentatricopeptide repeat protein
VKPGWKWALAKTVRWEQLFKGNAYLDAGLRQMSGRPSAANAAARLAMDCRDMAKAAGFYRAILARDPIDEEAARGLMRCCAKAGDLNSVRKVYKVLCESLRRELEDEKAEPLPETTTVFRELTGSKQ